MFPKHRYLLHDTVKKCYPDHDDVIHGRFYWRPAMFLSNLRQTKLPKESYIGDDMNIRSMNIVAIDRGGGG